MAGKRRYALACRRIPDLDFIVRARRELCRIVRPGHTPDAVIMALQRRHALACHRIPNLDCAIVGARREPGGIV